MLFFWHSIKWYLGYPPISSDIVLIAPTARYKTLWHRHMDTISCFILDTKRCRHSAFKERGKRQIRLHQTRASMLPSTSLFSFVHPRMYWRRSAILLLGLWSHMSRLPWQVTAALCPLVKAGQGTLAGVTSRSTEGGTEYTTSASLLTPSCNRQRNITGVSIHQHIKLLFTFP